jgi:hypothetical protein
MDLCAYHILIYIYIGFTSYIVKRLCSGFNIS